MNAFATLIVTEHLLDLRRQAEADRLARQALATEARLIDAVGRRNAAQRLAGRSARSLSRGLAALAARVDPVDTGRRSSTDTSTRSMAA
jgi:hypothetical protein